MAAPAWAKKVVEEVAAEFGAGRTPPTLKWRRRSAPGSTGLYCDNQIIVCAGPRAWGQPCARKVHRWVLLHELAHWLLDCDTPSRRTASGRLRAHDEDFFSLAFRLYREHGIPMRWAAEEEVLYRPRGAQAALRALLAKHPNLRTAIPKRLLESKRERKARLAKQRARRERRPIN